MASLARIWGVVSYYNVMLLVVELMFCLSKFQKRGHFAARCAATLPAYLLLCNSRIVARPFAEGCFIALDAFGVFVISALILVCLFKMSTSAAFFYASAAYAVEGILFVIHRLGIYTPIASSMSVGVQTLLSVVVYCVVLAIVWNVLVKRFKDDAMPDIGNRYLVFFVVATVVVSNVLSTWVRFAGMETVPYSVCSMLCYILLLSLEFDVFRVSAVEHERDLMERIFHERERQQLASRQSIETVNIKFHDLKHQIEALRQLSEKDERERSLDDLEWSIREYDAATHTGDPAIDAILTEKSMRCWGKGIDFTCMADGKGIASLGVVDAYTLLGNALDNAIEAAERVPESNGRIVTLRAVRREGFICIDVENSCVGRVPLSDGIPATTKGDSRYHGFGMKSMLDVVNRHAGNMTVDAEKDRFRVRFLIPMEQAPANGTDISVNDM